MPRRTFYNPRRVTRTGAVTVEMAVCISLAFFLFFTALEFCRVSMIRHTVEHALYEGARRGIVPGSSASEVSDQTKAVMRTIGISNSTVTVNPVNLTDTTPTLSVRIQLRLDQNLFAPAFFFRGRTLDRTITMQREGLK